MKVETSLRKTSAAGDKNIVRDTKQPVVVTHIGVRTARRR